MVRMKRGAPTIATALAVLLLLAFTGFAQRGRFGGREETDEPMEARPGEFHFLRLEYTDLPQYHRRFGYSSRDGQSSGWWSQDWPAAENHFTVGVQRLTRIDAGDPRHVRLTDDRIFEYPWIYATQTGWWDLSDAETARLREYLLRGGFLVVDDFWGPEQWGVFQRTMERVFPNQPITEIAQQDSVMHVLYNIEPKDLMFIPGSRHLRRGAGGTVEIVQPEGTKPEWRAMYDHMPFRRRAAALLRIVDRFVTLPGRWLDAGCGPGVFADRLNAARG